MKILVFDTETNGLPEKNASIYDYNKWPHIIQLSYILYDLSNNSTIIKDNYIKLNSIIPIDPSSLEIHGLTHEFLNKNGIHIIPALKEFNEYLDKCDIVVGHNISFDKRLIFVECLRHKIDQKFTKFINNQKICKPEYCTMKNTTQFCEIIKLNKSNKTYIKQPKLIELYSKLFLNEPLPKELHNSLVDILCTLRCYLKYVYNIDIVQVNEKIANLFLQFK
jgi:DNA polymerase III epsilon subunit-like protein